LSLIDTRIIYCGNNLDQLRCLGIQADSTVELDAIITELEMRVSVSTLLTADAQV